MKIAVVQNLPSGGARRALAEHCGGLRARGHKVEAYFPDTADEALLPIAPSVDRVHVFRMPRPPSREASLFGRPGIATVVRGAWLLTRLLRVHRAMAEAVDREGYDVVLASHDQFTHAPSALRHLSTPSAYYCQEPLRFVYEAPVGLDVLPEGRAARLVRHLATAAARRLLGPMDARNVAAARMLLANSHFSHESILRAYGRGARVVFLGVDTSTFRPLGLERDRFVLSVGALHPAKGHEFVVEALGRLPVAERPRLVIVADRGYGTYRQRLEALAERRAVALEIATRLSEPSLVELYGRAALVAYAPYLEPFGLVMLEAMACGTPVVAVAEGGVRESVRDGVTGRLAPRDAAAFADSVGAVLSDRAAARRLAEAALEEVRRRWTWEASCAQLEVALRDCAAGSR